MDFPVEARAWKRSFLLFLKTSFCDHVTRNLLSNLLCHLMVCVSVVYLLSVDSQLFPKKLWYIAVLFLFSRRKLFLFHFITCYV